MVVLLVWMLRRAVTRTPSLPKVGQAKDLYDLEKSRRHTC
jgi:hypothetical protein